MKRNIARVTTRTCLVTGAGRGIGRSVAHRLSTGGHRVALTARSSDELTRTAEELPGPALAIPTEVTDSGEMHAAFDEVERQWDAVEVLVLNAGTASSAKLTETTDEDWDRALATNLTAPFRFVRRAVPAMVRRGWGRVVVVASVAAQRGDPYVSAYTASKHGVLGLVRSAAAELARTGVTVNAVCPGFVDTPMTATTVETISARTGRNTEQARRALADKQPIGRLVDPEEVADAVELLVRNAAVTGQTINVDGGAVQS